MQSNPLARNPFYFDTLSMDLTSCSPTLSSPTSGLNTKVEMLALPLSKYDFIFDTCAKRVRGFPKSLCHDADTKWKNMAEFYRQDPHDRWRGKSFCSSEQGM
jgi:hypothetical protein